MDSPLILTAALCMVAGLVGCFIPLIPGPPLAYAGILLLHFSERAHFSTVSLLVWLAIVIAVQVTDYVVPMVGSKWSGGSRWGTTGCFIGTLIGLLFMPWGLIVGPFVGAFVGETLGGRGAGEALRSGCGSLLGFLLGVVIKCMVCGFFLWKFITALM